ncbi:peptidoglycan-binding domain-containing protein [Streptomyces dysideae]|uniref:peptidoglycan-binding domain-containing protein n=1 Tax=Streptomyces dysideae TaxID=909626 RepID=UPI000AD5EF71|nr:peptidoglycan-binding domain-containing protein [Streptomyces dysideae]
MDVSESRGHLCPECGEPRGADNTPTCGCGERVSEALRDARTAEAAAAEDFDPLRIRPYVELDDGARPEGSEAHPEGETQQLPAIERTMPLRAVPPGATSTFPPPAAAPRAHDLRLFEADPEPTPAGERKPHRRGRTVLLGAGGAVVAVVAAAGLASGLFTYETPSRDAALPEDVRASIPAPSPTTASAAQSTPPASEEAPASPPPSPTVSPTPTRADVSPTPSPTSEPTQPSPSASPSSSSAEGSDGARQPPVLRRGAKGAEVTELELRLQQTGLYVREPGGSYNEGVEDAVISYQRTRGIQAEELGVYDLATRERLESETSEP